MQKETRPPSLGSASSLSKLGSLKTVEDVHNTEDDRNHVAKIAEKIKNGKGHTEVDQSSEKETDWHLRKQDDELERPPTTRRKFGGNDTND